jgi:hypothetical protein
MDEGDNQNSARECPYCSRTDECLHVLLIVDTTFRTAESGVLRKAFNERWTALCENMSPEFDERESFDALIEEANACADSVSEHHHEGGPGMSSSYTLLYVASAEHAAVAVKRFANGERR